MTFSIVARDNKTGEMGVAIQSHFFSVGGMGSQAVPGVGAMITQANVDPRYDEDGIKLLMSGMSPKEVLEELISTQELPRLIQFAIVNASGESVSYTGDKCVPDAGHYQGDGFSCQANMMENTTIWGNMARAFEESDLPFAERLILALEAGQEAGGDIRGKQSAAILVVSGEKHRYEYEGKLVDLRVEDHPDPIAELKRLLGLNRAYDLAHIGRLKATSGDYVGAADAYATASKMYPDLTEFKLWRAVYLVDAGLFGEAKELFSEIFKKDPRWYRFARNLQSVERLSTDFELPR